MTFDALEISRDQGIPISLLHINYGSENSNFFAYTDFDEIITYRGVAYQPVPFRRGSIQASGRIDDEVLEIEIAPKDELVEQLFNVSPTQTPTVIIRSGHFQDVDGEYPVSWSGRLISYNRKDTYVELGCESIVTSMRRVGLKRNYQHGCSYALYEHGCFAQRRSRGTFTPNQVANVGFTITQGWHGSLDASKFLGGYVEWVDPSTRAKHIRTIVDIRGIGQATQTIVLDGKTDGLTPAVGINFFAGCNHLVEDCKELHNNILNFGGQPNIPLDNPVGTINRYY